MTDHIAEIEKAMKWCSDYLSKSADVETLEPFFVRLFIIDVVSSYEKTVYNVVVQRTKYSCDPEFARYVEKSMEIRGRPFGATWRFLLSVYIDLYKDQFENSLYKAKKNAYGNLVKLRNNIAHGGGTDIRLRELMDMHNDAKAVPCLFASLFRRNLRGLPA